MLNEIFQLDSQIVLQVSSTVIKCVLVSEWIQYQYPA